MELIRAIVDSARLLTAYRQSSGKHQEVKIAIMAGRGGARVVPTN